MSVSMSSQQSSEPVKRKRGRPPKHVKPESFPTMTLQFDTSPHASPAELNSNKMVQMGEPDSFTPLMKVSPIRKKRRLSDQRKVMLTPNSVHTPGRQNAALNKMSEITHQGVYHTPPETLIRSTFDPSLHMRMMGGTALEGLRMNEGMQFRMNELRNSMDMIGEASAGSIGNSIDIGRNVGGSEVMEGGSSSDPARTTRTESASGTGLGCGLLASAIVVSRRNKSENMSTGRGVAGNDIESSSANTVPNVSSIGNSGDAAISRTSTGLLESASLHSSAIHSPTKTTSTTADSPTIPRVSYVDDGAFSFQLVVDDLGRAKLSPNSPKELPKDPRSSENLDNEPFLPRLQHANTAIGIETPREDDIVPQTPRTRDDLDTYDTLAYNLTPQFNSMMYLVMNINSPQQRKNPVQSFINGHEPEFRASIDTELLGRSIEDRSDKPERRPEARTEIRPESISQTTGDQSLASGMGQHETSIMSRSDIQAGLGLSDMDKIDSMSSLDDGDARAALKRVVQKREVDSVHT